MSDNLAGNFLPSQFVLVSGRYLTSLREIGPTSGKIRRSSDLRGLGVWHVAQLSEAFFIREERC